jgi:hypothetical protein
MIGPAQPDEIIATATKRLESLLRFLRTIAAVEGPCW